MHTPPQRPPNAADPVALPPPAASARPWQVMEIEGEVTPAEPTPTAAHPTDLATRTAIPDLADELIVAGLDRRAATVAAGETAHWHLALLNNGTRHARFTVQIEGWVEQSWLELGTHTGADSAHPQLELWLHPGERTLITLALTPQRTADSRAGDHPFAVVVRSADEPQRLARLGATLTIQPFTNLRLGDLQPRILRTSWQGRAARLTIPITNGGNTEVTFFVGAHDPKRRFRIDFLPAGAKQPSMQRATLTLGPGASGQVLARVTPLRQHFVALRNRTIPVQIAVGLVNAQGAPLAAQAALVQQPVIGPWLMAAALFLLTVGLATLLLLTTLSTTLATPPSAAPIATPTAIAAPPVLSPQVITIVVQLAQPAAPVLANVAVAPSAASAQAGIPIVTADQVAAPGQAAEAAPLVRADQVSAPEGGLGSAAPAPGFRPIEALAPTRAPEAAQTYQQMFADIALRYDLNWRVLAAQAYIESSFDSVALGEGGAMGLMQILPTTWREWAPTVDAADPFDAYNNTLVAAVYLDYLRTALGSRGHGEISWMLVAYNWGIDKVNEHLDAGLGWTELPRTVQRYAEEILRIAETLPLE